MNDKKFTLENYGNNTCIKEDGRILISSSDEKELQVICERLNELYDNNALLEAKNELIQCENKILLEKQKELFSFRLMYNALIFNEWSKNGDIEVYKSKKHDDGELCIDGNYFIVVAILPEGQITNHYYLRDWDLFKIPEYERVKHEFDGHTSADVVERMRQFISEE